jgi:hypothetical protein
MRTWMGYCGTTRACLLVSELDLHCPICLNSKGSLGLRRSHRPTRTHGSPQPSVPGLCIERRGDVRYHAAGGIPQQAQQLS